MNDLPEAAAGECGLPVSSGRIEPLRLHDRRVLVLAFGEAFPQTTAETPRSDRATSRIYSPDANRLFKICAVQSTPRNQLLRAIGLSRAQVEERGNLALRRLGLVTPRITGVAVALNPFSRVDSALLVNVVADKRECTPFLNDARIPESVRLQLIENILDGLRRMAGAKMALRDFRLCNILLSGDSPEPVWIDNDVKRCATAAQLRDKMATTFRRVLLKDAPGIPDFLAQRLRDELPRILESAGAPSPAQLDSTAS